MILNKLYYTDVGLRRKNVKTVFCQLSIATTSDGSSEPNEPPWIRHWKIGGPSCRLPTASPRRRILPSDMKVSCEISRYCTWRISRRNKWNSKWRCAVKFKVQHKVFLVTFTMMSRRLPMTSSTRRTAQPIATQLLMATVSNNSPYFVYFLPRSKMLML